MSKWRTWTLKSWSPSRSSWTTGPTFEEELEEKEIGGGGNWRRRKLEEEEIGGGGICLDQRPVE